MNKTSKLIPAFVIGLSLLAGCTTGEAEGDDDQFRVINGEPAPSDIAEYAATVAIHQRSGAQISSRPFCSGTLIAPSVVLTAAHCCDKAKGGPKFSELNPAEVAIYFGEGPAFVGGSLTGVIRFVSQVAIHPSYNRFSLQNDLCLVRLSAPNPSTPTIAHLPAAIGLSDADAGTLLDHVGFGYSDLQKTQYGVKLHAEIPLAGLGCVVPGCPTPGTDGQFSYIQDGDPYFGPCNGDSGGPAFIVRNNETYVAGITSYGDSRCELYGVSTNVSAYQGFIDAFIGGPDTGSICSDGVCDPGESCDGRQGTIACPSDCAGKTTGKPWTRFCYVGGSCEGPGC